MVSNSPASSTAPGSPAPGEQRKWQRHACGPELACHIFSGPALDFWAVRVQNLSLGGINLVLDRLLPTGKVVIVELQNRTRQVSSQRQVRIIYSLKDPKGDLVVGGAFSQD